MPAERTVDFERVTGTYRDGNTTIRAVRGDGIELFWGDWPHGRYLTPLADGTFFSRTSGGRVRFEPVSGPAERLVARWGDSEQSFQRVEEQPSP